MPAAARRASARPGRPGMTPTAAQGPAPAEARASPGPARTASRRASGTRLPPRPRPVGPNTGSAASPQWRSCEPRGRPGRPLPAGAGGAEVCSDAAKVAGTSPAPTPDGPPTRCSDTIGTAYRPPRPCGPRALWSPAPRASYPIGRRFKGRARIIEVSTVLISIIRS